MIKLVIADDEKRIQLLIEKLIDWEALGASLVATASSGTELLEQIITYQPDIVITDIRMPSLSGLAVIEKVRKLRLDVDFIVVSGYRHFEYAYNALKFGVEDYLLKPIQKEELNVTLKKLCVSRGSSRQAHRHTEGHVHTDAYKTEDGGTLLNRWILAPAMSESEITTLLAEQAIYLTKPSAAYIFVLMIDHEQGGRNLSESLLSFSYALKNRLEYELDKERSKHPFEFYVQVSSMLIMGFVSIPGEWSEDMEEKAERLLMDTFSALQDYSQKFHGYQLTLLFGHVRGSLDHVPVKLEVLKNMLYLRLFEGVNRMTRVCLASHEADLHDKALNNLLRLEQRGRLREAISRRRAEDIRHALHLCLEDWESSADNNYRTYRQLLYSIIYTCFAEVFDGETLQQHTLALLFELLQIWPRERLQNCLTEYLIEDIMSEYQIRQQQESLPVRRVKDYLAEHYGQLIGLEEAAEHVGLNAIYLSELFKRCAGLGFNEYLTQLRVEAAKKLLSETHKKISVITRLVGYGSPKYFSQVFSKEVGISPSLYRKLHM